MDIEKKRRRRTNPRQNANIFSKLTFWYTTDLFKRGFKRELEEEDLYEVLPEFESRSLGDRVEHVWEQCKHRQNGMFWVFWKIFGPYYCILSLNMVIHIIFRVVQPMIISKLVFFLAPNRKELHRSDIYLYSALLILPLFAEVVCRQNYFFLCENLIIKFRTAVCTFIYRKLLKLPASRLHRVSFGNITNLITRDINAFDQFFINFSYGWSGLVITIVTCWNMYQVIGFPAVVVIIMVAILIPVQVLFGLWVAFLKNASCAKTDKRIAYLQEILSNMRSTKMYVWEQYAEKKITAIRKEEINFYFKVIITLFGSIVLGIIVVNVTFFLVLTMYVWFDLQLSTETIFFIIGIFGNLSFTLSICFPYATFSFSQVIVAIKRTQTLVEQLEVQSESIKCCEKNYPRIRLKDVTVSVGDKIILNNVSCTMDKGLTLVTGVAGSGKSFLLVTLLKEFEVSKGDLVVEGIISYACQESWLFPSTIRQNIIFGSKYEHKRYQDVIKACDLQYDFDLLEKGDSTVVADRGINLSKGQQSRIKLARAIYKESDIYLLDDCLSSLDPPVERFIFTNCILKFLHNKIVLLVSHNKNLIPYANKVLKLSEGHLEFVKNDYPAQIDDLVVTISKANVHKEESETKDEEISDEEKLISEKKSNKIYGENKIVGGVCFKAYQKCVNMGGSVFLLAIFCFFFLTQLSVSYKDNLVRNWANLENTISEINNSGLNNSTLIRERNEFTFKFAFAVAAISLTTLIRAASLFFFCKKVSIKLHNKMLKNILNVSLVFFDSTFIGNIVNRFSKDLVAVDECIPLPLHHLTAIVFETAGNVVMIASTSITFLIPTSLLFTSFAFLRYVYLKSGRALKRMDASTKSPVIGYLNATMEGLLSIKVFGAENILKEEFEKHHNLYNSASFSYFACTKAFVFAIDLCVAMFVTVVIVWFAVFNGGVLPADFGLVVSQALVMGTVFYYAVSKETEIETQMTSVERAIEYTAIETEAKTGLQIKNWPKEGEIKYENVFVSVDKSNTYLLKNLNFFVTPKEKIGLVGRTGSGKSSVVAALFRLYGYEGKITIDGIDIKTLSLSFLRSCISVIPQDPILFDGTLRDNIDPERKHSDEEIWSVLETVKFKTLLNMLHLHINEFKLTCGQRQLISLTRVLLSNNKILVLDELIENVDSETADLISDIIDKNFASCTIIKIAHKLKFVMDCKTILVIDNGEIVECGSPDSLLENKNGLFYKMVLNSTMGIEG